MKKQFIILLSVVLLGSVGYNTNIHEKIAEQKAQEAADRCNDPL
jgi:hypothetical protein